MKKLLTFCLLIGSFMAMAQAVPTAGSLTLNRSEIKSFLAQVNQEMVYDTVDNVENIAFKKACQDALKTQFSQRTILVPAKYVKKLASQYAYSLQQYETSKRDVIKLSSILIEWKKTGDTALRVLDGASGIYDKSSVVKFVRKGKMSE